MIKKTAIRFVGTGVATPDLNRVPDETRMTTASPSWTDGNLAHHHGKRLRENPGCFEDHLGITGRPVTVEEYRDRSVRAVTGAWCEYEAQGRDFERSAYLPGGVSYVDDDLVVAVNDLARTRFARNPVARTEFRRQFVFRRAFAAVSAIPLGPKWAAACRSVAASTEEG